MSSIGEALLGLMSKQDPRQQLIQAVVNGSQGGVPYAAPQAAAPATDAPAGGAAGTPPVAQAYTSPPDLSSMYKDLMNYQTKADNISRGFGLIGSAVSQDGNREATLRAFMPNGEGVNTNPAEIANLALSIQKNKQASAVRAAQLAALPTLAAKYGITVEAARALFEGGKLEDFIQQQEKPDRTTATNGLGQPQTIDQRTGQPIGEAVGPAKPVYEAGPGGSKYLMVPGQEPKQLIGPDVSTADTKNYDAYVNDELVRNPGSPDKIMSFNDWSLQQNRSKTTPATKAEGAEAQKMGDYWGSQYVDAQKAGQLAQDTLNNYDIIQKGLESGVTTGALGEADLKLRKLAQYIGLGNEEDVAKIAGGELVQKITNKMSLLMRNPDSGMGMPGSLSDKDLAFLKDSQIGLSGTEAGNKLGLEVFRRMEQRKIAMAQAADDWVNSPDKGNGSMKGFASYWRDWSKSHPMFDDLKVSDFAPKSTEERKVKVQSLVDQYKSKK